MEIQNSPNGITEELLDQEVEKIRKRIRGYTRDDLESINIDRNNFVKPVETECERILKEGRISESFLDVETRNGFLVDAQRKKLWLISLDLLLKFDDVCRKHGIRYFLAYGTLLGAVRHKGFIPWDDDIDTAMFKEDFDRFIKLSDEFEYPYFLQNVYTDPTFFISDTRIRNTNTSWIDRPFMYQGYNHGIHLSVAVLDNLPENAEEISNDVHELLMKNAMYMRLSNPDLTTRDKERIINHLGNVDKHDPYENYQKMVDLVKGHPKSEYVWTCYNRTLNYRHDIYRAADFDNVIYMDFEGFKMPVPSGYDHILSNIYGNYMEFPPPERRVVTHGTVIYDADIPYKSILGR